MIHLMPAARSYNRSTPQSRFGTTSPPADLSQQLKTFFTNIPLGPEFISPSKKVQTPSGKFRFELYPPPTELRITALDKDNNPYIKLMRQPDGYRMLGTPGYSEFENLFTAKNVGPLYEAMKDGSQSIALPKQ